MKRFHNRLSTMEGIYSDMKECEGFHSITDKLLENQLLYFRCIHSQHVMNHSTSPFIASKCPIVCEDTLVNKAQLFCPGINVYQIFISHYITVTSG
jgi:hypothetical protein